MTAKRNQIIVGNLKIVRNVNRAAILNIIREKEPISRVRIAHLTGLNKSTVSSVVTDLLTDELVYEEEERDNNVGRNPISLRLKRGQHFVGAININAARTWLAVVDIDGSVIEQKLMSTKLRAPEIFVKQCVEGLLKLRDKRHIKHLKGIGVSVAGIVDPVPGHVIISPNLGWENFAIGELLQQLCPHEGVMAVDNDSNASALAELWFGKHDEKLSNFVFLSVGPGIGTGIVVENKLMAGEFHASGEFGHMILYEGGQLCSCGNYGCWEAYASDQATVIRYNLVKRLDPAEAAKTTVQDIISAAKEDDPTAIEVLRQKGRFLGLGLASIIKALDPKVIVVGGRITQAWNLVYPELIQVVSQRSFFDKKRDIHILPTSLEVRPPLLGAATLAIKDLFDTYRITR